MSKSFCLTLCLLIIASITKLCAVQPQHENFVTMAEKLEIPWSLVFLPDGNILITERPGRVRLFDKKKGLIDSPIYVVTDVAAIGEGGLLGIEIDPDFQHNHFVYVYYTYLKEGKLFNKVTRFTFDNHTFLNEKVVIDQIPGGRIHNGGRIKFGPDGHLYIGTGDAGIASLAQDKNSLAGKILRIVKGTVGIYSFGHRNVQGLAWDSQGNLWETEHGAIAQDELNRIEQRQNYGWPVIQGYQEAEGMQKPVIQSENTTWAPAGLAFHNDSLFFVGLRGRTLYQYRLRDAKLITHDEGLFGRLRDVVVGPDGFLYLLTSNRDGRGVATPSDDRLIKINKVF